MNTTLKQQKSYEVLLISCLICIFIFISTCFIFTIKYDAPINVITTVQTDKDNVFQLFFADDKKNFIELNSIKMSIKGMNNFQELEFKLPTSKINKIRLDFGNAPGEVQIKNIVIKSQFKQYICQPDQIKKNFSHINQLEKYEVQSEILYLYSNEKDPFIFSGDISAVIKEVYEDKAVYYVGYVIIAICCILLLWGLVFTGKSLVAKDISYSNFIVICIFIAILWLPNITNLLSDSQSDNSEKREFAKKPDFRLTATAVKSYPQEYEKYFNDRFGLRDQLIKLNNYLNVIFLRVSPVDKVTIGKNGWWFYSVRGKENPIDLYRGLNLLTSEELEKVRQNLEEERDWLELKDIPYVLLITPNTHTIYPEFLPDSVKKVNQTTQLDQVINYLSKNSDLNIIDLRDDMIMNKSIGRLYHKTDTHWNDLGAFVGYQVLMREISRYFPEMKGKELEDYKVVSEKDHGGDLAEMLGADRLYGEENIKLIPRFKKTSSNYTPEIELNRAIATKNDNSQLPKIVTLNDSYLLPMIPFLSEHFSTAIFNRTYTNEKELIFNTDLIEKAQPDVVVRQVVERLVYSLTQENPKIVKENIYKRSEIKQMVLPNPSSDINYYIDELENSLDYIKVRGWAFINDQDSLDSEISIVMKNESDNYVLNTVPMKRQDVTEHFGKLNYDDSGFYSRIPKDIVEPGNYNIGVLIKKGNLEVLRYTDKYIKITK
jgi:hypothetical protein